MKFHLLGWLLIAAVIPAISGAQTPGPRLVVLNKADAKLTVVDPASGKVLGSVATGGGPHRVAVSTDGKTAFVGNYGGASGPGNTISVVDLTAIKELRRFDVSPLGRPHGMFFAAGK